MRKFSVLALLMSLACPMYASWYWPFGSDAVEEEKLRISELMQPATEMIDRASDLADEGKISEAIEEYSKVIAELDKIERENPGRAEGADFATLRNKRAYVLSTIDSLRLRQVKDNERAVVVSDTTGLEKHLAEEKAKKAAPKRPLKEASSKKEPKEEQAAAPKKEVAKEIAKEPRTRREKAIVAIAKGDFEVAERVIGEMLAEKPNGAVPLNLNIGMHLNNQRLVLID